MQGKDILTVLSTITTESMTNGTMSDLWSELPDMVSGKDWVAEVVDSARQISEYIQADEDYSEDTLSDYVHEIANSEMEDYYSNINRRVQALSLWAYPELDDEVAELAGFAGTPSLTDLNSLYLYAAMRGLGDTIVRYLGSKVAELEEVNA